jgi:hypothetical protein
MALTTWDLCKAIPVFPLASRRTLYVQPHLAQLKGYERSNCRLGPELTQLRHEPAPSIKQIFLPSWEPRYHGKL